ncbi:MAG: tetratricopeptide repeat protein [Thiogranum sp.]|nr:tetratricopeptide repeat protein [Thiogranum sp.]
MDATEKEQLEVVQKWWKENGSSLLIGLLLGLSILFGGKAWLGYKETQAMNASNIYMQMLGAMSQDQIDKMRDSANQLISNYSGSAYATFAAMALAKVAVSEGAFGAAETQLQWAMDNAETPELENMARLRLARVLLQQEKYSETGELLAARSDAEAFGFQYLELEGDLALSEGETGKAAAAYQQALEAAPPQSPGLSLLTTKYESVAGAGNTIQ